MLYLNPSKPKSISKLKSDLTLTNVVFEFAENSAMSDALGNLTLTNVVFE